MRPRPCVLVLLATALAAAVTPAVSAEAAGTDLLTATVTVGVFPTDPKGYPDPGPVISGRITSADGRTGRAEQVTLTASSAAGPISAATIVGQSRADGTFGFTPYPESADGTHYYSETFTVTAATAKAPVTLAVAVVPHLDATPAQAHPPVGFVGMTETGSAQGPVGSTVLLQKQGPGGTWTTVEQGKTQAFPYPPATPAPAGYDTYGFQRMGVTTKGHGSGTFRVVRPADAYYAEADSAPFTLTFADWKPLGSSRSFNVQPQIRFDGCRPITWKVNLDGAPRGAIPMIKEVLRRIHKADGDTFTYLGTTHTVPTKADAHKRLADPAAPDILFAWINPGQSNLVPSYTKGYDGYGGAYVDRNRFGQIVRGGGYALFIKGPQSPVYADFSTFGWGAVAMHETGHVMGLGHVHATDQIMQPAGSIEANYGAGDLKGLRMLGRTAGCGYALTK